MPAKRTMLTFDVAVFVEEREGYFAATTRPFAITVYGDSQDEAEQKALTAVELLLDKYSKTTEELSDYLKCMAVKHFVADEGVLRRYRPIVRECRREMRLGASVGH